MEVKGLTSAANISQSVTGRQISLKSLPHVSPKTDDDSNTERTEEHPNKEAQKAFAALLQTDSLVNEISHTAQSINAYAKSLSGIIDQGIKENSEVRKNALEKEANQVFKAIHEKSVAIRQAPSTSRSIDPVRSEVEAKIDRTLKMLFPEDEREDSTLPQLSFTNKDLIISIQTKIQRTSQYLDELRSDDSFQVKDVAETESDVAQSNAESAQTSLRDVDAAFKLVQETSKSITDDQRTALFAVGALKGQIDITS